MDGFHAAVTSPEGEGRAALAQLSGSIGTIHGSELTSREWIHFYCLALRFGFFRLGYDFRLKARESALAAAGDRPGRYGNPPLKRMAALMESGNWDLFDRKLGDSGRLFGRQTSLLRDLGAILRQNGDIREIPQSRDSDPAFADFVRDKTICFVGPAKSQRLDAAEIEAYERVVRCNTLRAPEAPDPVKGGRCDITYLNRNRIASLEDQGTVNFSGDIGWAVSKDGKSLRGLRKKLSPARGLQTRATRDFTPVLFNGSLTAAPNALLDLMAHGSGPVKVFHTDLMLTVERATGYDPKLQGTTAHVEKFILSCAGPHDPVTSYFVLSSLFRAGRVTGDEGFTAAMSLGESAYMGTLEKLYGRYAT